MRALVSRRDYVSPCAGSYDRPGHCDHCDRELVACGDQQRYCSPACRKAITSLPL